MSIPGPDLPQLSVTLAHYLVVSGLVFGIGITVALAKRNAVAVLMGVELMLNAGNLALIGFARMHGNGEGQIFALIVMVVAACEVVIGLGLIVALHRNRLPIDMDRLSLLRDPQEEDSR